MSRRSDPSLRSAFGRTIQELRTAGGLSRGELGRRSKLDATTIKRVEGGKLSPSLDTLEALAGGLNVSLVELLACVERRGPDPDLDDLIATIRACSIAPRVVRRLVVVLERVSRAWPALRHFIERESES